jgi:Recombinase
MAGVVLIVAKLRAQDHSLRQIAVELVARSIRTRRGGEWTATAVRNVLARNGG